MNVAFDTDKLSPSLLLSLSYPAILHSSNQCMWYTGTVKYVLWPVHVHVHVCALEE